MLVPVGKPRSRQRALVCLGAAALLVLAACAREEAALRSFHRWGKIELTFRGPALRGCGEPNPFAIPFDVMFTGPEGRTHLVPGFYDGDGKGGLDGDVWKVRFSADRNGVWSWHTQSPEPSLNALSGRIAVVDPPPEAPEFYRWGRLEYVGQRYLKFREGGYWIKAGADEPENLLGGAFGAGEAKKRQIDYLASAGVNSVYIVTHNIDGDAQDTWPWLGDTQEEAKANHERFDVARLERWRDLFEYIPAKGVALHVVLEDDSSWTGYDATRYYREMVARFGYLPAVCFNFCEEYNERHTLGEALDRMELLATIDPYNHPRAIHNVNIPAAEYVDNEKVHAASIQTQPMKPASLNQLAVDWFEAPRARRRRPLVIGFDEARPAEDRRSWWSAYMGGGVWEGLLRVEKAFAEFDVVWRELVRARKFMEGLPVERMFPANHVVVAGEAFCLARPGEVYALYLPAGGRVEVSLVPGNTYRARWFDPRAGGRAWSGEAVLEGGRQALTAPDERDWAVRIDRIAGEQQGPPTAASAKLVSVRDEPVEVYLAILPADLTGPLAYEVVTPPRSGSVTGTGAERTYTPRRGFTGRDSFRWRARSPAGTSNVATVTITCNATGINAPPRASDLAVRVRPGEAVTFSLRYVDRDGPGPYRILITKPPAHGSITGLDNDITYTPAPSYRGTDRFQWQVSDNEARSNPATVRIIVQD